MRLSPLPTPGTLRAVHPFPFEQLCAAGRVPAVFVQIGDRIMRSSHSTLAQFMRIFVLSSAFLGTAAQAGELTVSDGWIRALPGKTPAGGYFTLSNDSGRRMVLTGASSPVCGMLMLHKTDTASGMASMNDVKDVPIAVGQHVIFAPGGYHLMCMDPTAAVEPGNKVPVTLIFSDGTQVTNEFSVRNATGH
jgi:periplasmic copper chaperone A